MDDPVCRGGQHPGSLGALAPPLHRRHPLEAGRGIEYAADHLGHKNIENNRIYAQISHPLREQLFRDLERHPKIVRIA